MRTTVRICNTWQVNVLQLYAYIICGQVSVKGSFDMYEPFTYVCSMHEVEVTISGTITVTDLFLCMHVFI